MWKGKNKNGKDVTLLNPNEKVAKAVKELKTGVRYTNNNELKLDENGKKQKLRAEQKAYRAGMISQASDSQKAWKNANPDYKRKTKSKGKSSTKK